MSDFWNNAIIPIYFVYGLAFYTLGIALFVESGRSSELTLARAIRFLAGFGFLHGAHEWLDMLEQALILHFDVTFPLWADWLRLSLLVTSFIVLLAFGQLLLQLGRQKTSPTRLMFIMLWFYGLLIVSVRLIYNFNEPDWISASSAVARHFIGIPGSALACIALWRQREIFRERGMGLFVNDLTIASIALALYGVVGQIFVPKMKIFPGNTINEGVFLDIFGVPVQLFRAIVAIIVTFSMLRVLRALEVENQHRLHAIEQAKIRAEQHSHRQLEKLNQELRQANEEKENLLHEVQQRDALRGVLLHRITAAQEAERQRIARELHDETGQALTGLAMGVHGVATKLEKIGKVQEANYLHDLEKNATKAISDLRILINDLRPPQLDDMGLVSALRWMVERHNKITPISLHSRFEGNSVVLLPEVETTIFRIAQEGINNVVKHSSATEGGIVVEFTPEKLVLKIWDNGKGFIPDVVMEPNTTRTAWGLLGMQERANLIDASFCLESTPGEGSTLCLEIDLEQGKAVNE